MDSLEQIKASRTQILLAWLRQQERPTSILADSPALRRFLKTGNASNTLLDQLLPYYLGKPVERPTIGRPKR